MSAEVAVEQSNVRWPTKGKRNEAGLTDLSRTVWSESYASSLARGDGEVRGSALVHVLRPVSPPPSHGVASDWAVAVARSHQRAVVLYPPRLRGSPSSR
jgi:hypothetical protein